MLTSKQPYLLSTKVLLPRSATGQIERPRLLGLIAEVQAKRLTVIKAGGGFGKTSLAVAWAERLQQNGNSVAWLALDSDDDEPTRFLFYVSHALRHVCASAGEAAISLMLESSLVQPRTIVSLLINDLADIENEIYLFLDDYHSVTDAAIHDAVSFLLRHAPSHFHLVLTTRLEPLLPLAGLLANNQLLEIDASALRFDLSEIRRFLELIGHGQSNKEIARDLGIAPETVKSHVKNIFVKLAVERRVQAVSRAQSLGLVQTH